MSEFDFDVVSEPRPVPRRNPPPPDAPKPSEPQSDRRPPARTADPKPNG